MSNDNALFVVTYRPHEEFPPVDRWVLSGNIASAMDDVVLELNISDAAAIGGMRYDISDIVSAAEVARAGDVIGAE